MDTLHPDRPASSIVDTPPTLSPSSRRWSVGRLLAAMVLAAFLALILVVAAVIWEMAKAADARQRHALVLTANSIADAVDAELEKHMAFAAALAQSPAAAADDLAAFRVEALRLVPPASRAWVVLADREGRQIVNTRVDPQQALPRRTAAGLAVQARAIATGKTVVSDLIKGPVFGEWAVTVDAPVLKDGKPFRAVVVAIHSERFQSLLAPSLLAPGWLTGIMDNQGRFVARYPFREPGSETSPGWSATRGQPGIFEYTSLEGVPIVNANAVSDASGWTIGVAVRAVDLRADAWRALGWSATGLLMLAVAGFGLVAAVARHLQRSVSELRQGLMAALDGDARPPVRLLPEFEEVFRQVNAAIAARRQAEQRLQVVTQEVSHRFKNLLTIVQLVAQRTTFTSRPEFLARFAQRLQALAAAQDLLLSSQGRGVDLEALLRSQLAHFADSLDTRISLGGPPLALTPRAAQTLGMAAHELATNAGKHGALSSEAGRIEIVWRLESSDDGEQRFHLRWQESGGPPVMAPSGKGLGSAVIERLVAADLDCSPALSYAAAGFSWSIDCPADAVLAG
ncbi:MAG: sensor histidine kinase [Reyranellaceae bacterium]